MGTTALIGATTFVIMFVAGTRWRYLLPDGRRRRSAASPSRSRKCPSALGRFLAFLYPEKYPADAYQQVQGLIALGSGGVEGLGLGNGRQKMAFLP